MARGRKSLATTIEPTPVNDAVIAGDLVAHDELAAHVAEIDAHYGDGLPYERERLINETRFYMAQSAEAMLEAGKRLIRLKEHEPHGEFMRIVEERLGVGLRSARRMMQATAKFMSPQLEAKWTSLSTLDSSKLFELVAEDDDQLASLADGGTIAGLTLDKMDCMSVRELKAALKEAKADAEAMGKLLEDKNKKIDKLSTELEKKPAPTTPKWSERFIGLNDEISGVGSLSDEAFGKYLMFVDTCEAFMDQLPLEQAGEGKSCIHRLSEAIERTCHLAAALRDQFEIRLGGYIADDKTHILPANGE